MNVGDKAFWDSMYEGADKQRSQYLIKSYLIDQIEH